MNILGVDPGFLFTGLIVIRVAKQGYVFVADLEIKSPANLEPNARVEATAALTYDFARENDISAAFIEDQANVSIAKITEGKTNANSLRGRDVANRICGVLDAGSTRIKGGRMFPVGWITPAQAKKAVTGHAYAKKEQVERAVSALLLDSHDYPVKGHVADAGAIAIAGARRAHVASLRERSAGARA